LHPDWEARNYKFFDDESGERSFASQLFQVVGINAGFQALNEGRHYMQGRPNSPKDTGERVIDDKSGNHSEFIGLTDAEVRQIGEQITVRQYPLLRRNTNFSTVADLQTKLAELQKAGNLPAVLQVMTKNEPF
jgi:hypothetical protein